MLTFRVMPWIYRQHTINPALPEIDSDQVYAIAADAYRRGNQIMLDKAAEYTGYPLDLSSPDRFYQTPCGFYVVQVRSKNGEDQAVAILEVEY